MKYVRLGIVVAWALTLGWLSAPGQAQQPSTAHPEMDEQAMAVLKRMTAFLAQAPRFSVTVDTGFDVVQDSGQKIEFGETRQMVLRRPDRLRIDVTKRDGSKGGMVFDGKDIAVFNITGCKFSVAQMLCSSAQIEGNRIRRERCTEKNAWDSEPA